ncbi:helix-turn-helix domain-containing protein [Actinocorallia sp. B10E7]|uniref:helix-turn-helix domain-containing protein n=1 Tax=Actinocorallia sp. B10E7 TaxID=3153558 RepID=UPI00325F050B
MGTELGDFLRACRARVQPSDLGVRPGGGRRRVPGARREEVAAAAGVSPDYYTRIEQGRLVPSPQVLDALVRALSLRTAEREHLMRLAGRLRFEDADVGSCEVRAEVLEILRRFDDLPAVILSKSLHALAWTPVGGALLGLTAEGECNMARRLFFLPASRRLYPDWSLVAEETVGHLRRLAAREPSNDNVARLIGQLTIASPDFARLWALHQVSDAAVLHKRFDHPQVGVFELVTEILTLPHDQQTLAVYRAAPGTANADALILLNTLITSAEPPGPGAASSH